MIPEPLQALLDDLRLFPDRADRIEALIEIAKEFQNAGPDEVPRTSASRVPGCESEAYVASTPSGLGLRFKIGIDNPQGISAMALARILQHGLDGQPLGEVVQVPDDIVFEIFGRELSMGKSLGLMGMVRMVKAEAARATRS